MWSSWSLWTSSLKLGRPCAKDLPSFSLSMVIEGRKNTGQVREILGRGEVGVDLGSEGLYVEGRLTNELLVISQD